MSDGRKGDGGVLCNQAYCIEHPNVVSRIAMLEKGMEGVELSIKEANETLRTLKAEIFQGILNRYPATIVWIISILTAFCSALLTVVLGNYLKG
jgi:hypothetical protein